MAVAVSLQVQAQALLCLTPVVFHQAVGQLEAAQSEEVSLLWQARPGGLEVSEQVLLFQGQARVLQAESYESCGVVQPRRQQLDGGSPTSPLLAMHLHKSNA